MGPRLWLDRPMNPTLVAYAGTAFVLIALDLLWLGVIAKPLYRQGIGHLMGPSPLPRVAVFFYLLFAAGLLVFAVVPHEGGAGWGQTLLMGALFGFFAYATYDLTNLATLRDWPLGLSMIDMGWGTFVSAVSAGAGKLAMVMFASG